MSSTANQYPGSPLDDVSAAEPLVGRELRAATLGEAAASVPQPAGAVGAVHPGGQTTGGVDVVGAV